MQFLIVLTLAFSLLVAIFALQNAYPVTVHFLSWRFDASLALVILFSVLSGALLLGIFGLVHQARSKITSWRIIRKNKGTGEEADETSPPRSVEEPNLVKSEEKDGGEVSGAEKVEDPE